MADNTEALVPKGFNIRNIGTDGFYTTEMCKQQSVIKNSKARLACRGKMTNLFNHQKSPKRVRRNPDNMGNAHECNSTEVNKCILKNALWRKNACARKISLMP